MALKRFDQYFTDDAIIRELCRMRAQKAKERHEGLFFRRMSTDAPAPESVEKLSRLLPPRRSWHQFRPRTRLSRSSASLNAAAMQRAVKRFRNEVPRPSWAVHLDQFI